VPGASQELSRHFQTKGLNLASNIFGRCLLFRVAIVTGGSAGIGHASVVSLLSGKVLPSERISSSDGFHVVSVDIKYKNKALVEESVSFLTNASQSRKLPQAVYCKRFMEMSPILASVPQLLTKLLRSKAVSHL
jgi:hypothetical protein